MDNFNLIVGKSNCTPNVVQVNNFSIAIGSKMLFSDSELVFLSVRSGNIYVSFWKVENIPISS